MVAYGDRWWCDRAAAVARRVRAQSPAGQGIERRGTQCGTDNAKGWAGSGLWGVLEYVPPCVVFAENAARDCVPVCLRVLNGGNSLAVSGTRDRPAGFSNPDGLAGRSSNGLIKGAKETRFRVFDGVVG